MSTQERINQLAQAALRAAPSTARIPKPVTFMPSFEKLRSPEFASPGQIARALPVPPAAGEAPAQTAAVPVMGSMPVA